MESIACGTKRMIVARFDEGEDLLLSLKRCAEEHGVTAGSFNAIGGLKEIAYGLYAEGKHRPIRKISRHIFELLGASGNISLKEGTVLIHAHVLAADEEHGIFGGHLLEGSIVCPFAEIFIQEGDAVIGRSYNEKSKLWHMRFE